MTEVAGYLGLFFAALAAGSLLPVASEAPLVALLLARTYSPVWLVVMATLGNVAGGVVNWLIGRAAERLRDRRWFPASPAALERARAWYHRYGRWSLLLSWLPFVGDPLTVVAGLMREPLWSFLLLIGIAKLARYVVVAALTLHIL
jgi:membrane protein YqaA with SNARE-associated domain